MQKFLIVEVLIATWKDIIYLQIIGRCSKDIRAIIAQN